MAAGVGRFEFEVQDARECLLQFEEMESRAEATAAAVQSVPRRIRSDPEADPRVPTASGIR